MPQFTSMFDDDGSINAVVQDLGRSATAAPGEAESVARKHAKRAADSWRDSVPVRSRKLRDSIDHDVDRDGRDVIGVAYSEWFVAYIREYGTASQPPQGEARAALDEVLPGFARDIADIPRL